MSPSQTSPKALPAIDTARCTGCGWCVAVCAPHVLSLQVLPPQPAQRQQGQGGAGQPAWGPKRSQLHDAAGCTGCALCAVRCPFDAIRMVRTRAPQRAAAGPAAAAGDEAALSHSAAGGPVV